jgi:hypothetical protein
MSQFRITFDGPALQSHEMDVRELAPALLAVGDLLDAATRALNGNRLKPQTNVRGSFKTGSFAIDFSLTVDWLLKMRDVFTSDTATAISNAGGILGILGVTGKGLLFVLKWLRGRKITRVDIASDKATIYVDDDAIDVELPVLDLLRDVDTRNAVEKVLEPLRRDGITTVGFGTDESFTHLVRKDDLSWYAAPPIEDVLLLDERRKMVFSIVSLAFKDDNKWRLYDGAATIHASITDGAFLHRVDQSVETFAKGDVLICIVRVQQWHAEQGPRTEYEVVEVLEHRSGSRQLSLPGT